jgi:hypothetical protein
MLLFSGIPDEHILDDLNDHMRTQIMAHLNGHILRQVPVFANTPPGFIKDLVACCHSQLYVHVDSGRCKREEEGGGGVAIFTMIMNCTLLFAPCRLSHNSNRNSHRCVPFSVFHLMLPDSLVSQLALFCLLSSVFLLCSSLFCLLSSPPPLIPFPPLPSIVTSRVSTSL